MFRRAVFLLLSSFALPGLLATPAWASLVIEANATMTCSSYSLLLADTDLTIGDSYQINYTLDVSPGSTGFPLSSKVTGVATSSSSSGTVTASLPSLSGTYRFTGSATLLDVTTGVTFNTIPITFSPSNLTCGTPPPPACSAQSSIASNFNGTSVPTGVYVWFSANFTASGIPSSGTIITVTKSIISFTANGTIYNLAVPNAQITFSPNVTCTSTTFDTMTNSWMATVPISGDDEIFLTGLAWPVPSGGLPGGINPVNWQGTFNTSTPGISLNWKWGAAVYSGFTTNYNALAVKAVTHKTACGMDNGDQAGTPEGVNGNNQPWKQFVVGGSRGGGGSNWTGSWSGTASVKPVCHKV